MKINNRCKVGIIITAAGSSTRIGGDTKKEYLPYKNGTVLSNCAIAFLKADYKKVFPMGAEISHFVVTCPIGGKAESEKALYADAKVRDLIKNIKIDFVEGGDTRQKSVFNGLDAVQKSGTAPDIILIHDGARPFVTEQVILAVTKAVADYGASVPGVTPIDTQKEIDEEGFIVRHLVRKNLSAVQTPQGFQFEKLYNAHVEAAKLAEETGHEFTDDTEIWGNYVGPVKTVAGDVNNIKITYPSDLERL